MGTPDASEAVDALALGLRVRTLRIGLWPSAFTCILYMAYTGWTWGARAHSSASMALCVVALVASIALAKVPIEPLVRGRWREPFFLAWSASIVALVTFGAALDGGVSSPLAFGYFLPLAFAALSYPPGSMLAVAGMVVGAALGLAALGGPAEGPFVVVLAGSLVAAAWICGWQARNLEEQRRSLARVSRTDPLTGALNRRGFEERLIADLDDDVRDRRPVTLVLFDLDHFKQVNDTQGHAAGDALLCWVVATLRANVRPGESIGRLGGDEFAVALHEDRLSAETNVERLRGLLAARTGVSAGLATRGRDGHDPGALHHAADLDLYAHKHGVRAPVSPARELSWAAALAACVDDRMAVQHEHSRTVAELAAEIATQLGWTEPCLGRLRLAATLHDVGKIHVPVAILRKPGPLDAEEQAEMEKHADAGADIVERVEGLGGIAPWIRHSHERVDGGGYPAGLAGDAIPLASRILLVADAYDAMISDRPYRRALAPLQAVRELRAHAGTQFDPACVVALEQHLCEAGVLAGVVALPG